MTWDGWCDPEPHSHAPNSPHSTLRKCPCRDSAAECQRPKRSKRTWELPHRDIAVDGLVFLWRRCVWGFFDISSLSLSPDGLEFIGYHHRDRTMAKQNERKWHIRISE